MELDSTIELAKLHETEAEIISAPAAAEAAESEAKVIEIVRARPEVRGGGVASEQVSSFEARSRASRRSPRQKAQVTTATIAQKQAQVDLERIRGLYQGGSLSKQSARRGPGRPTTARSRRWCRRERTARACARRRPRRTRASRRRRRASASMAPSSLRSRRRRARELPRRGRASRWRRRAATSPTST